MKAMILAAGRGERMRPLTDHTPKPLLEVGGKPLIVWHLLALAQAGITDIVINHAWLGDKIEAALGGGSQFGVHLQFSAEGTALETAGGIAKALPLLGNEPFLVLNGDVFCDWPLTRALALTCAWPAAQKAHLVMVGNPEHNPSGDFVLTEQGLVRDRESNESGLTYSGLGIYSPSLFDGVSPSEPSKLAPLLRQAMARGQVSGEQHTGTWIDVGTPERLADLNYHLTHNSPKQSSL